jgi:HD superfamily phosphohydrolase
MASLSEEGSRKRIVVDNIHGDIQLSETEWRVVNTASFQRLGR